MILAFGEKDAPVRVDVPEQLARPVAALFEPLHAPGSDHRGQPLLTITGEEGEWVVRGRGATEESEDFDHLPDLLAFVEHRLALGLLGTYAEDAHLHAAGTVVAGRALLALGASGAGKSSLALAWSRAGYPLLGDDVVLLGEDARVTAFPRLVKVDRERLSPAGIALEDTVAPDSGAPEAWHDPASAGGWAQGDFDVGLVAGVQYRPGAKTHLHLMGEADVVRLLLDQSSDLGAPPEDCVDRFIRLTHSAAAVQVTFGDVFDAAQVLITELEAAPA